MLWATSPKHSITMFVLVLVQDMIPRMSLWTVERLRDEMMLCALRCRVRAMEFFILVLHAFLCVRYHTRYSGM